MMTKIFVWPLSLKRMRFFNYRVVFHQIRDRYHIRPCVGPCVHNKPRAMRRWRKAKIVGKLTTMTAKVSQPGKEITKVVTKQVSKMASRVASRVTSRVASRRKVVFESVWFLIWAKYGQKRK